MCVALSLSLSVPRSASSEKGVSACLLLKGREGSLHGGPSLLSLPLRVAALSLSFPRWRPSDRPFVSRPSSASLQTFCFSCCVFLPVCVCVCLHSYTLFDWLIFELGVWFWKVILVFFQFSKLSPCTSCPAFSPPRYLSSCSLLLLLSPHFFLLTFSHSPPPINTPPPSVFNSKPPSTTSLISLPFSYLCFSHLLLVLLLSVSPLPSRGRRRSRGARPGRAR